MGKKLGDRTVKYRHMWFVFLIHDCLLHFSSICGTIANSSTDVPDVNEYILTLEGFPA